MNRKIRKLSILKQKVILNNGDLIEHWLNVLLLSMFIGPVSFACLVNSSGFSFIFIIFFLVLIVSLLLKQKITFNKLITYNYSLTSNQFKSANEAAALINGWVINSNRKDYFKATKYVNWQRDGIRITSFLENDHVLINSMISPALDSIPFSFGINEKNRTELLNQYRNVLTGQNVLAESKAILRKQDEAFWNESEFSLKNFSMKLLGYPIGIGLFVLSILMISSLELTLVFFGIITCLLVACYFYYDFKVIVEKRKKKSKDPNPKI